MNREYNYFLNYANNISLTAHVNTITIFESQLNFNPKITIAIPTYKRTEFLKQAIDSAIGQIEFSDYDIIVVDNDPTRGCKTEKLMLEYNYPKLSYYKNIENIQMVGNWNRLFTLAKGEYVIMLHDDDLLYPDYLSVISAIIRKYRNKYDAIYAPYLTYNMKVTKQIPERSTFSYLYGKQLEVNDFLWGNIVGPPVGMCLKRSSLIEIGGFSYDNYPSLDYDFYIKFAYRFKSLKLFGYPIGIYRIADNESFKTDTLINFVKVDLALKQKVLTLSSNRIFKTIWLRYINVFANDFLIMMKNLYQNTEIDTIKVISDLGIHYNWFDMLIFNIMNLYKRVLGRYKIIIHSVFNRKTLKPKTYRN